MKWKFIFNADLRHWPSVQFAIDCAKQSGYQFFCWNGKILHINGEFTGIKEEDCY